MFFIFSIPSAMLDTLSSSTLSFCVHCSLLTSNARSAWVFIESTSSMLDTLSSSTLSFCVHCSLLTSSARSLSTKFSFPFDLQAFVTRRAWPYTGGMCVSTKATKKVSINFVIVNVLVLPVHYRRTSTLYEYLCLHHCILFRSHFPL